MSENRSLPKHRRAPSVPSRNLLPVKSVVIAVEEDLPEPTPNEDLAAPLCNYQRIVEREPPIIMTKGKW
jgi:hypothetical protein